MRRRARQLPLVAGLVLLAVTAVLLLVPLPGRTELPFIPVDEPGEPLSVLLDIKQVTPTLREAAGILTFPDLALLLRHRHFELLTGTYDSPVDLVVADASVEGTNCTYAADPARGLPNNARLVLTRGTACDFLQGTPTGRLLLRIAYNGNGRVALWTRVSTSGRIPAVPRLEYPPVVFANTQGMLDGSFVAEGGPGYTRAQLLAYMWRESTATAWLFGALAIAGGVFLWGLWCIDRRGVAGTFAIALGLGTIYALVVPPLQAPDEPTHLLTFARVTGEEHVTAETARWAWRVHFERIRFHPGEKFRASDIGRPLAVNWTLVSVQDEGRSAAASRLWRALAALLPSMTAPSWLMVLRVIGALTMALALMAVSRAAAAGATTTANPALALLLVPTLLFFGMHASNHALLASAYVLIAGGVALGVWRADAGLPAGVLLGAGLALAVAGGRIGLAVVPLTAAAAAGWLRLNGGNRFLRGAGLGLLALPLAAGPSYFIGLAAPLRRASPAIIGAGLLAAAFGAVLLWLLTERRWWTPRAIARTAGSLAWIPVLLLAASIAIDLPRMQTAASSSLAGYTARAMAVVLTFPRLRGADALSSDTFWGGFGWLDTYLPRLMMTGLVVLAAAGLVGWLLRMTRRSDAREWSWTLVLGCGFAASLALLAAGSYLYAPELHGRYLLGVFLPALAVLWTPFAGEAGRPWLLTGCAIVHGTALATILLRYF